jgi:hypothetical protein
LNRYHPEKLVSFEPASTAIDPATPELLSTGMQQLVGVLGIVMGLDENHGATDVH